MITRILFVEIENSCLISKSRIFVGCEHWINVFRVYRLFKEELEDAKGVIVIRKSKDRQYNGQKTKDKRTNNDLQNIHIKLKTK